jgi:diguanylate cyclase (GGDEF)-like protein
MRNENEKPSKLNSLKPAMSVLDQNHREIRNIRILLLFLLLADVASVLLPRVSNPWRVEINFVPHLLFGFVVLVLIFTLHLASQRKVLGEVSTALTAANSYVYRLEQICLIDPPTQLFNRRYLDLLFNQQLKWLNRNGRPATLLLFELLPDGQHAELEEIVIEAAFVLRSNFRASDYVVRYCSDQFLVVLPDTTEQEAQFALSRLIDKVDHWNRVNEKWDMALRLELIACPPGANLWEKLREIEERLRDKSEPGLRMLIPKKPAAYSALPQDLKAFAASG